MKSKRAGKKVSRSGEHLGSTPTRGAPRFTESATKKKNGRTKKGNK
mgnify:CR=1 FL=1|jgi:hypothetical protein